MNTKSVDPITMRDAWKQQQGVMCWLLILIGFISSPLITTRAGDESTGKVAKSNTNSKDAKGLEQADEYYELLTLFVDTLDQIDRNYVKDVSRRELMEAAIKGMLTKLDQYSNYIPPKEVERFRTSVENEFGGIGIQVSIENGFLKVISPIVGSPAYKAGLIAGDSITKIEGESTKGISLDEAVKKMKGKVGTKVNITVVHPDDPMPKEVAIERAIVRVQSVMGNERNDDDSWNYFYDQDKKIGYLRVSSFSRHTVEELRAALKVLREENMKGLILDLRFNPGGLLSSAIEVCDMFIASGRIVSTEGRNTPKRVWDAHKKGTLPNFPMAVLVNRYSASASEIVSACLQDHKRATVIGARSWGKGSVQNIIDLEGGKSALKLTTAGYMRPSGKNIHRFEGATEEDDWGVTPNDGFLVKLKEPEIGEYLRYRREKDIVRKADPEEEPSFEDRQLNKALELLREQIAKEEQPKEEPKTESDDKNKEE